MLAGVGDSPEHVEALDDGLLQGGRGRNGLQEPRQRGEALRQAGGRVAARADGHGPARARLPIGLGPPGRQGGGGAVKIIGGKRQVPGGRRVQAADGKAVLGLQGAFQAVGGERALRGQGRAGEGYSFRERGGPGLGEGRKNEQERQRNGRIHRKPANDRTFSGGLAAAIAGSGGYAVIFHGQVRTTKDLALFIRRTPDNARRAVAALEEIGFACPELSPELFISGKGITFGEAPMRVDVLAAIRGIDFEAAWERKQTSRFGPNEANYIGLDDLIANKEAVARPQDIADAQKLKAAREKLGAG